MLQNYMMHLKILVLMQLQKDLFLGFVTVCVMLLSCVFAGHCVRHSPETDEGVKQSHWVIIVAYAVGTKTVILILY